MARQKNDGKGRLGGRSKGTPNKITSSTRQMLASFILRNARKLQKNFDLLEPKDKLLVFEKLLKYVLPSQSVATVELSELSDGDIENVVNSLLENLKGNDCDSDS